MPFAPLSRRLLPVVLPLACATLPALAQQTASNGRSLWEVGAVGIAVDQQAYPGSSRQVRRALALPYLIYRGKFLRADSDGVGVRPVKTPLYEFDVSGAYSFGSSASNDPVRRGMPNLGTVVEFGPRLKVNLGEAPLGGHWRLDLPVRGVFDISHQLTYRGAVFQPGLNWSKRPGGGWAYGVGASVLVADSHLARTFYGVDPLYATPTRPAYQARGGLLATRLSVYAAKDITRDWTVFAFAHADSVAGAANRASPLVQRTTGTSAGIGVSWTWLRSEEKAFD